MTWPDRVPNISKPVDFTQSHTWQFEPLDEQVFAAVRLAREVGSKGLTYPAVYNAANEQAVEAFHQNKIGFLEIADIIDATVQAHQPELALSIESVLAAEIWARAFADQLIEAKH
jgi:1-deoxy-D-xylulose-5-phosphate reductoisomerase